MRYFSMFSGIGGFEYGIEKAINKSNNESSRLRKKPEKEERTQGGERTTNQHGTQLHDRNERSPLCVGYSEIDKYAIAIYEKHYPNHTNYGDATRINPEELPDFDLLCGGFPCQAFSIAGNRKGFEDTRGTLFFDIARILEVKRPKIVLLENVKGLLNHDQGKTFRVIIQTMGELGYDVQWMVVNSKFFGVPQNRERTIIIGSIRGTPRPEILPFNRSNKEINEGNEIIISRKWAMPNKRTFTIKPIKEIIHKYKKNGLWLDPFPYPYQKDAVEFLSEYEDCSVDGVLFDPPYSPRQLKECYDSKGMTLHDTKSSVWANWKDHVARVIKPGGLCLSFGWSSQGLGKNRGFEIIEIMLVAHGGNHNDTIIVVERKNIGGTHIKQLNNPTHSNNRLYSEEGISPTLAGGSKLAEDCTPKIVGVKGDLDKRQAYLKDIAGTLAANPTSDNTPRVVEARDVLTPDRAVKRQNGRRFKEEGEPSFTLTGQDKHGIMLRDGRDNRSCLRSGRTTEVGYAGQSIRRLTPTECERLQAFPDNWTAEGTQGPISDTQRYKTLGNAVTTNVIQAIVERIYNE